MPVSRNSNGGGGKDGDAGDLRNSGSSSSSSSSTNNITLNKSKSTRGILRCKSERTSPGRRRQIKKNVRFSDCLDLEQAQYAISTRTDAYDENYICQTVADCGAYNSASELQLEKYFWLPTESELKWLVGEQCVHLESVRWFGRAVTGVVRVKNLGYEKKTEILYTYDDWNTSHTAKGAYSDSPSAQQDRFSFCIFLPYLKIDLCIYFCIRYECGKSVFWDNNSGANYKFVCHSVDIFDGNAERGRGNTTDSSSNPFFDSNCSIFF